MMDKLWIALCVFPISALAQTTGNKFVISGQIGTLNAPAKVYLQYFVDGKINLDSVVLNNGAFEFKGKAPLEPTGGYLLLNEKGDGRAKTRDAVQLFVEKGNIKVRSMGGPIAKAVVTGTQNNLDLGEYNRHVTAANIPYEANLAKIKNASDEEKKSAAFKAEQAAFTEKMNASSSHYLFSFVRSHPNSAVSILIMGQLAYSSGYTEVASAFEDMSPTIKSSAWGKRFAEQLSNMKKVALGSVAPDFTLPDTSGNMISLASLRGKYVLIDLWASWCGPCRAENPNLVRIYHKYKDQNFTIIGVSLDRQNDKAKWTTAIKKDGLIWTQVSDLKFWDSEVAKAYGVHAIPQNFLLDPAGKIIAKSLRGDELETKLTEILSAPKF